MAVNASNPNSPQLTDVVQIPAEFRAIKQLLQDTIGAQQDFELLANRAQSLANPSLSEYPSTQAVSDAIDSLSQLLLSESSASVNLGGDFGAAEKLELYKVGKMVTAFTSNIVTHTNGADIVSGTGIIPSAFRPEAVSENVYANREIASDDGREARVLITTLGTLELHYLNANLNKNSAERTDSLGRISITYKAAN